MTWLYKGSIWLSAALSLCAVNASGCSSTGEHLAVDKFFALYGESADCNKHHRIEGKTIRIMGDIDCGNVFDRRRYPNLPYEKFMLRGNSGKTLEVWVNSEESERIFDSIHHACNSGKHRAFVRGRVTGFDMPIMGKCQRGFKIDLTTAADISLAD